MCNTFVCCTEFHSVFFLLIVNYTKNIQCESSVGLLCILIRIDSPLERHSKRNTINNCSYNLTFQCLYDTFTVFINRSAEKSYNFVQRRCEKFIKIIFFSPTSVSEKSSQKLLNINCMFGNGNGDTLSTYAATSMVFKNILKQMNA